MGVWVVPDFGYFENCFWNSLVLVFGARQFMRISAGKTPTSGIAGLRVLSFGS